MARRQKPLFLCKQDYAALDDITADSGHAQSTLVPVSRLHVLKRKGVIEYEELPGFRQRYPGLNCWRVWLTDAGRRLYSSEGPSVRDCPANVESIVAIPPMRATDSSQVFHNIQ